MIYDVILVVIFAALILFNCRRGAAGALAGIATALVSYGAATALGRYLSVMAYDAFISPAINRAVTDAVDSIGTNAANSVADAIPSWLSGMLGLSGADVSALLSESVAGTADTVTNSVQAAVQPAVVNLLTVLLTILLFFIISFLLRKLVVKHVLKLFNIPVIRTVNKLLGGVIGFVDAFLLVSMLAYLLKLLMPNISDGTGILNESTIYNSFIFYHFYSGNIFATLTSWIGM